MKTVMPRIRKSLRERGLIVSLGRGVLLPIHLFQEYRRARKDRGNQVPSTFDLENQVATDGEINGWTHLSDLDIPSPNWIYGTNYTPIEPVRFRAIFSSLHLQFEDFVFVDFGSGKGRALLLASELPFKRVLGLEFSPDLHAIAQRNIERYASHRKSGPVESVCMDFLSFAPPPEPLILFFYDPCEDTVLIKLVRNLHESLRANPRASYLIYVAPTQSKRAALDAAKGFTRVSENVELGTCVYRIG
ncbi:MAG TPA: class I SAM-dependent methyltransferase [Candidatus Dormibacteraeota bacterium]|nr:class I SAM-dependent methyltransferase [Candidatus Dormibacteraeota bacterium]